MSESKKTEFGVKVQPGMRVTAYSREASGRPGSDGAYDGIVLHVEADGCLVRPLTEAEGAEQPGHGSPFFARWADVQVHADGRGEQVDDGGDPFYRATVLLNQISELANVGDEELKAITGKRLRLHFTPHGFEAVPELHQDLESYVSALMDVLRMASAELVERRTQAKMKTLPSDAA